MWSQWVGQGERRLCALAKAQQQRAPWRGADGCCCWECRCCGSDRCCARSCFSRAVARMLTGPRSIWDEPAHSTITNDHEQLSFQQQHGCNLCRPARFELLATHPVAVTWSFIALRG
eukprot:3581067-Prymnesium_polylepis.1